MATVKDGEFDDRFCCMRFQCAQLHLHIQALFWHLKNKLGPVMTRAPTAKMGSPEGLQASRRTYMFFQGERPKHDSEI